MTAATSFVSGTATRSGAFSSAYTVFPGGQGECLELAHGIPALAPVRDSKAPAGPVIPFGRSAWSAFVGHLAGVADVVLG
jgi:hypothetical protein